jgi:hypothetical protein
VLEGEQRKLRRRARQSSSEITERVGEVEETTGRFHLDQQKLEILRLNDELNRRNSIIKRQRGWVSWLIKGSLGGGAVAVWEILKYLLFKP